MNKQEFLTAIDMIESIHHDLFERKHCDYSGKEGMELHKKHRNTTIKVWFNLFQGYDVNDLVNAINVYLSKSRFIPKPADLLDYMIPVNKEHQVTASEAWEEAYRALSNYGREQGEAGLASLSHVVRRVVRGFGWRNLCNQNVDDFFMNKWGKIYNETRSQEIQADERDPERVNQRMIAESPTRLQLEESEGETDDEFLARVVVEGRKLLEGK